MGTKLSKEEEAFISDHGFTKRELKRLKKDFLDRAADKTNPELHKAEFKELFEEKVGRQGSQILGEKLDLDEIFDSMDTDRSGSVSFKELLLWLAVYLKGSEEDKLKHMFKAFDADGNNVLDRSEITAVLEVLKLSNQGKLSDSRAIKKAAALVKELDKDRDGAVTLEEWIRVGKETRLVEELLGESFLTLMANFRA
jgi:Ca2+-binding EF-hand superfamily protein